MAGQRCSWMVWRSSIWCYTAAASYPAPILGTPRHPVSWCCFLPGSGFWLRTEVSGTEFTRLWHSTRVADMGVNRRGSECMRPEAPGWRKSGQALTGIDQRSGVVQALHTRRPCLAARLANAGRTTAPETRQDRQGLNGMVPVVSGKICDSLAAASKHPCVWTR